jgi:hypothetical protein
MPGRKKTARADFVVDSARPLAAMLADVDRIVAALADRPAEAYRRHWRRR